ncbi:hypothetical protein THTE_0463 [Thermogutta terrifontis]|uniref:DUF3352 domain-containing protein n=1 Tax=Thermogutta terrifontis TaxID=1331910 RepID=A0A286RAT3_9BACT|nr:hypothetical protein [Thermogutta terrifontis]ASV73065.1 hypothetical protein THTE_0463 [Thermogutta terrifontis]
MRSWNLFGAFVAAACGLLLSLPGQLLAQQPSAPPSVEVKPVVVVSFAGIDRLFEDVEYLGKLAGMESLAENLKNSLAAQTGEPGVPGVDAKRPCGVVVQTNGFQFLVAGYVPVTDFDKTREWLKSREIELKQEGDLWSADLPNGQTVFVANKNNWAIIAADKQVFSQVGDNPPPSLTELSGTHDLSVLLYMANIPPMFKQLGLSMIQQGMEMALQQQAKETGQDVTQQREMIQRSFQQMQVMLDEIDTMTVGLTVNSPQAAISLVYTVVPRPGTEYARNLRQNQDVKTRLSGFVLPDATFMLRETARLGQRDIEQFKATVIPNYKKLFRESLDKEKTLTKKEKRLATDLIDALLDALGATVEKGTLDLAFSGQMSDKQLTLLSGMMLEDGAKVEKSLLNLLNQAAEKEPDVKEHFHVNAAEYKGFRFHVLDLPASKVTDAPEPIRQMMGEDFAFVLAFSDHAFAMAAAPKATDLLKKAIDQMDSETTVTKLADMYIALNPLMKFISVVAEKAETRDQVQQLLPLVSSKDRVTLTASVQGDKGTTQIDIEEGVVKLLVTMALTLQQKAPQGPLPLPLPSGTE